MTGKTNAMRLLDTLGITYEVHTYEVDETHQGAIHAAQKLGISPSRLFKTLVVKGDCTGVMIVCIPADATLDLKALAVLSGNKRVEMVPLPQVQPLTGYIKGGVSPIGTKKKYPVFVDESALCFPWVSVSAGIRGMQIYLNPNDLCDVTSARTSTIAMYLTQDTRNEG